MKNNRKEIDGIIDNLQALMELIRENFSYKGMLTYDVTYAYLLQEVFFVSKPNVK